MIMLAFVFTLSASSQVKGDWYVGTGDVANVSWTDWAISPSVGYGVTDNLMVGLNVSQAIGQALQQELNISKKIHQSMKDKASVISLELKLHNSEQSHAKRIEIVQDKINEVLRDRKRIYANLSKNKTGISEFFN